MLEFVRTSTNREIPLLCFWEAAAINPALWAVAFAATTFGDLPQHQCAS